MQKQPLPLSLNSSMLRKNKFTVKHLEKRSILATEFNELLIAYLLTHGCGLWTELSYNARILECKHR